MKTQIVSFKNPLFGEVRVVDGANSEPWFVGKDVATILGYANPRKAIIDHIEDEDKMDGVTIRDSIGRVQKPILINESGLYSLILSSKLPQAKEFKRWVTSEVLPSIRKHGIYMSDESVEKALTDPDYLIRLATVIKEERERRKSVEARCTVQNQVIAQQQSTIGLLGQQVNSLQKSVDEMKEKVSYLNKILADNKNALITQIAQDYGLSGIKMNRVLHDMKIQFKVNGQWVLYIDYKDKGYTKNIRVPISRPDGSTYYKLETAWTPKGCMFLYYKLKAAGILPIMEREDLQLEIWS